MTNSQLNSLNELMCPIESNVSTCFKNMLYSQSLITNLGKKWQSAKSSKPNYAKKIQNKIKFRIVLYSQCQPQWWSKEHRKHISTFVIAFQTNVIKCFTH